MAVPQSAIFAALSECQVETRPRGRNFFIRNNRSGGRKAYLRRLSGPQEEYKIGEIRHLVSQLKLDPTIVKKHIPDL